MMSISQWVSYLEQIYNTAPIKTTLNSEMWFDDEYRAHFKINMKKDFFHAFGDVHGGVIATLIDNAAWFTAAARYPEVWISTTEFHTYILKPANRQNLYSEGFIIYQGKKQAVARAEVKREDGTLIAYGTATLYISNMKFDLEKAKKIINQIK